MGTTPPDPDRRQAAILVYWQSNGNAVSGRIAACAIHGARKLTVQSAVEHAPKSASPNGQLRLLIVTDAWAPQVNGVVRTLETLGHDLVAMGHQVRYATPEGRFTVALPTYPEIRL